MTDHCISATEYAYDAVSVPPEQLILPPQPPAPISLHVAHPTMSCSADQVYLIGGFDLRTKQMTAQSLLWDRSGSAWFLLPAAPFRLSKGAAAVFNEAVLLWGGWDGHRSYSALWCLRRVDEEPTATEKRGAAKRRSSKRFGLSKGSRLGWFFFPLPRGGCAPAARHGHRVVLGVASLQGDAASASLADQAVASSTAANAEEPVLYLFGGSSDGVYFNDVWRLWLQASMAREEAVWERLDIQPGVAPAPREDAVVAFDAMRRCLLVCGGGDGATTFSDFWRLSLRDGEPARWTTLHCTSAQAPPKYLGAAAVVDDGHLYLCDEAVSSAPSGIAAASLAGGAVVIHRLSLSTLAWSALEAPRLLPPGRDAEANQEKRDTAVLKFGTVSSCEGCLYLLSDSLFSSSYQSLICIDLRGSSASPQRRQTALEKA